MKALPFRVVLVALIVPLTLVVIGIALLLAWLPSMPAEIVVHWNFAGEADAQGPAWSMPVLLGVVGIGLPALFTTLVATSITPAGPTATQKLLAVAALFVGFFLTFTIVSSVALQRSGSDAVPPIADYLGIGLLAGFALAAVGWFVLPRTVPGRSASQTAAPAVSIAPGERVAWIGYARFSTGVLVALVATVVLATGAIVFAIAVSGSWWLLVVPVVLAVALLGTVSWRVRVDESGLTVRAALGWPMYRVAASEVAKAGTTTVVPLGEFGGYGIRFGLGGRLGVITRGGEALEVERHDGRAIVVTVDDAATAAGVLSAVARG